MSRYLLIFIAAAALIYFFYPRGDDGGEIASLFNEIKEAAGKKDTEGVTEHFSLQYKDEYGAGYPVVKNIIAKAFEKYDRIEASYSGLSAVFGENEFGDKQAAVNTDVLVTGYISGVPHALIGRGGSPDNVTVTLVKSGLGGWKITEVEGIDTADDY